MNKIWKNWKYKNITLAFLGIILAIYLSQVEVFHQFLLHLGTLGYLGAFLAGILFVSTFTVGTGMLILFTLAQNLHPLEIAILAGLGAVLGDLIIFHLVKDHLTSEMKSIYNNLGGKHLSKLLHTKYFNFRLCSLNHCFHRISFDRSQIRNCFVCKWCKAPYFRFSYINWQRK